MIRYPHSLMFSWHTEPTLDLATGRPIEGALIERLIACRHEVSGSGNFVPAERGVQTNYSYLIFTDVLPFKIPAGATTEIAGLTYTVILMENGQLNARIWV